MRIKILFFGATADIVGRREIEYNCENTASAEEVLIRLTAEYPALSNRRLLSALNQEYVPGKTILSDGDELAVFTAVSGG